MRAPKAVVPTVLAVAMLASSLAACSQSEPETPLDEGWAYLQRLPGELEMACDDYEKGDVDAAILKLRAATSNALGEDAPEGWYGVDFERQAQARLDAECAGLAPATPTSGVATQDP